MGGYLSQTRELVPHLYGWVPYLPSVRLSTLVDATALGKPSLFVDDRYLPDGTRRSKPAAVAIRSPEKVHSVYTDTSYLHAVSLELREYVVLSTTW